MSHPNCPTDQLLSLIKDELPMPTMEVVQAHLDTCKICQREIESLAADGDWWNRATLSLSGVTDLSPPQWPDQGGSIVVRIDANQPDVMRSSASVLLEAPRHPEMLGRIDEFEVEQKIGQGGMGVVFRGFDSALNRPVAIKILAPHLACSGVARRRFAREAQAAAAVVHPNVVPIYSVKDSTERPYIVMALVDGRSLQDHVAAHGPLAIKDVVRIAHQIAAGLAEAHKQGLVHRDIKPANILLEKDVSRVLITDFGLARAADDVAMTQTGWLAGTPHYMSPEQAAGKDIDPRSDLFSLGSLIYFMATGREPFRAEKPLAVLQKIDTDTPIPARSVNSEVPKTLERIIDRLLEKNPDNRMPSAKQLEVLLAKYLGHLQNPQSIAKPYVSGRSLHRRIPLITTSLLLASLVMIGLSIWAWNLWQPTLQGPILPSAPSQMDNADVAPTRAEETDWMQGLQSFEQWNADATSLDNAVSEFEQQLDYDWQNQFLGELPAEVPRNPMNGLDQIENQIQQLEHQFQQFNQ